MLTGDSEDPLDLQYLQFEACLSPLINAQGLGDFGRTHDWILDGLSAEVGHQRERTIEFGRIASFVAADRGWIRDSVAEAITSWAATFYYYCRVRGTLFEAAEAVCGPALATILSRPLRNPETIGALGMILNWATQYDRPIAHELTRILLPLFDKSEPIEQRTRIASLFSTSAGIHSGQPPRNWAEWAFENGAAYLNTHERFQLVWVQIDTVEDWDRLKADALAAIAEYAAQFQALRVPTVIMQATDQRAGLLKPAFILMQRFERSDDLLEILAAWYGVSDENRLRSGTLFVCLFYEHGTVYLGARMQLIERDSTQQLIDLTQAANRLLGLTLTIEGRAENADLFGTPNELDATAAPEFEASVEQAYALADLNDEVLDTRTSIVLFPGQPHPIQALMLGTMGSSLPIAASLETPHPDRQIKRALLWESGCDYYSGFELDAVEAVFADAGVEIDRRSGTTASQEDFLAAYRDPSFDLVWVAGHGKIDHWQDGSAQLLVGPECAIGIDAMREIIPTEDWRRLCFFNVCDGGVSAVNGGNHKLGMAPMLANRSQATISHLWPVNPLVASAFGVFLAGALAEELGFHQPFDAALNMVRAPRMQIVDAVRRLAPDQELTDRIDNSTSLDTELILHWGSPVFFQ